MLGMARVDTMPEVMLNGVRYLKLDHKEIPITETLHHELCRLGHRQGILATGIKETVHVLRGLFKPWRKFVLTSRDSIKFYRELPRIGVVGRVLWDRNARNGEAIQALWRVHRRSVKHTDLEPNIAQEPEHGLHSPVQGAHRRQAVAIWPTPEEAENPVLAGVRASVH